MIDIALIETVNDYLGILGLIGILFITIGAFDMAKSRALLPYVEKFGLLFAFLITLFGTALALVYSDIFGLIPCGLCWFERVFLFSQIFILGGALYFKDTLMAPRYGIVLSVFGSSISLYHHYIQMGGSEFVKCPVAGAGADCAKRFFFEYGFLTFPLMSGILFLMLILTYLYVLKAKNV